MSEWVCNTQTVRIPFTVLLIAGFNEFSASLNRRRNWNWCETALLTKIESVPIHDHIDNCQCNCNSLFLRSWFKTVAYVYVQCLLQCHQKHSVSNHIFDIWTEYCVYVHECSRVLVYMKLNAMVLSNREKWFAGSWAKVHVCVCVCVFLYILRNEMNHLPLSCDWYSKFSNKNMKHSRYMRTIDTHSLFGLSVWMNVMVCVCVHVCIRLITK